jgi:hypothetical protein
MDESDEDDGFLQLPAPPCPQDVVAVPRRAGKRKLSEMEEKCSQDLLVDLTKRSKHANGQVDLEARTAIARRLLAKVDPEFADMVAASAMVSALQAGFKEMPRDDKSLGVKRTVTGILRSGLDAGDYSNRQVQRLLSKMGSPDLQSNSSILGHVPRAPRKDRLGVSDF